MKKRVVLALLPGLLGIGGLLLWLSPDDTVLSAKAAAAAGPGMAGITATTAPSHFSTGLEGLPGSLQGTEVDGELEVDANGHLRITHGVRRVFDYFLSAAGEEPLDSILARIRAYIRHKLPAMAAAEAERLLDSYIGYKRGLDAIPQAQPTPGGELDIDALRRQMQQVQALRSQFFTPEVSSAFFGEEDAYDRYTLARLELLRKKGLSDAQRARELAALEEQLPPETQASMKAISQVQNLEALTQSWRQRNGSAAELRQIRESLVGPEATDRLEALDREREDWDRRIKAWLNQRAALLANPALGEPERRRLVAEARDASFSASEKPRVISFEAMRDRGEI